MTNFREQFDIVKMQVVMGKAHLALWKNLSKRLGSDPKGTVISVAPTFFGMTLEAHLNTAILHAARIFDTHRDSLNIQKLLNRADSEQGTLSQDQRKVLAEAVAEGNARLLNLEPVRNAVNTRRSKTLAHLDPKIVSNPIEVVKQSEITVADLDGIFDSAWQVLNGISAVYWDLSFSHQLIGVDDCELVVDYVASFKKRQREEYEAEFGPFPDPSTTAISTPPAVPQDEKK